MSLRIPYRGAGIAFVKVEKDSYSVFMGKRSRFPFFGTWTIPGGSVEKKLNETDMDGARREFHEETGLDLKWEDYVFLGKWEKTLPFFKWTTFFYLTTDDFSDSVPNEFFKLQWIDSLKLKHLYRRPYTLQEMKCLFTLLESCKDRRQHRIDSDNLL